MSKYQKMHKVTLQSLRPLQKWRRFLLPQTDASNILLSAPVAYRHSLHQKSNKFLCKCNTYNGQMTSSASISGFLLGTQLIFIQTKLFLALSEKQFNLPALGIKSQDFLRG